MADTTTLFASWLDARKKALGIELEKDLAARVQERTPREKFETIVTKLSKLRNDDSSADAYWFGDDEVARLDALAQALAVRVEDLRDAHRRSRARRTLVLDPRLPPAAAGYFETRARALDDVVVVRHVDFPAGSDPKVAIRDAARAARAPLVVLAGGETEDRAVLEFLRGADLPCASLRWAARGWLIAGYEDLVPLPPPEPPRRFDAAGVPVFPLGPGGFAVSRRGHPPELRPHRRLPNVLEEVLRAIARDEYLPMSIADAVSWHGGDCTSSESYHGHSEDGLRSEAGPLAGKLVVFTERPSVTAEALLGKGFRREFRGSYGSRRDERGVTLVWVDDGAVLAHGPAFEAVADWLRPWHELRHPTWATLTDDILSAGANPWHLEAQLGYPDAEVWRPSRDVLGARWSESAPATGPSFASVVLAWCRMEQIRLAEFLTDPAGDPVVRWEEHDPEPVRTLLARWAGRPSRAIPSGVELHLLLRQSARCEVVCVPPRDGELLRAFIDLGGKTLIEIRAVALRGTATPFVPAASFGPRDPAPTHEALELLGLPPDARKTWRWGPDSARIASSPRILFEGGDVALGVLRHDCDLQWGRNTGR